MDLDLYSTSLLLKAVAFLTGLALLGRIGLKPAPVALIVLGSTVLFVGILVRLFPALGFDYHIFWDVGRDVWAGQDPYSRERFAEHPFLNPPTALPVFALFALVPFRVSFLAWTVANGLVCLTLVACAQWTLQLQEEHVGPPTATAWQLSPLALLALTAVLPVSDAVLTNCYLGQLSILAAGLLLAALAAQGRGRSVWAGACLALATIKVGTMLPFLLLFRRKADRWTWAAGAVGVLGLCLMTGSPAELPGRLLTLRERVGQLEAPGVVNDYSFAGPRGDNILGFDRALYCLGLRDRTALRAGQYVALALLGAWVAYRVRPGGDLPRAAACALVALYATIFLYHRGYDAVLLVLPLVYSTGMARAAEGPARWWSAAAAVAVLLVLFLNIDFLGAVREASFGWGAWGWLAQAIVLPYGTWAILVAMFCLVRGQVRRTKDSVLRSGSPCLPWRPSPCGDVSAGSKPGCS
jgi:hypothetical protein